MPGELFRLYNAERLKIKRTAPANHFYTQYKKIICTGAAFILILARNRIYIEYTNIIGRYLILREDKSKFISLVYSGLQFILVNLHTF